MIRQIGVLICVFILFSCDSKFDSTAEGIAIQENPEIVDSGPVFYTDIIPENMSDSLKAEVIREIVNSINNDSTIILKEFIDSTMTMFSYYRNDSLLKIVEYNHIIFDGQASSSYYFLKNELIFVGQMCVSLIASGTCDPIDETLSLFFYNEKIVNAIYNSNRRSSYYVCGCGLRSENYNLEFEQTIIEEVKRLRVTLETSNKTP